MQGKGREMENNLLVKDDKYEGKYVALLSVIDHTIVAEGHDPNAVVTAAKKAGFEHPFLLFVPDKKMTCCF